MRKFSKGQSTLEYIIILAAVIGAIITIGGYLQSNMKNSYNSLGSSMETKVKSVNFDK
jgi:uncharacterized protein (UPF0333 family)